MATEITDARITVFYPQAIFSAWSVSEGLIGTLRKLGAIVTPVPVTPGAPLLAKNYPKITDLQRQDVILVSGPEHLYGALEQFYGMYTWKTLLPHKVGLMHETIERSDYGKLPIDKIKQICSTFFTPAAQDEKYGMHFLPFGVDLRMFSPSVGQDRTKDAIFIGMLYEPRASFLRVNGLDKIIQCGNCQVVDLSGVNVKKSVQVYVSELQSSRLLINLPSLCQHAVTKIFEGPACGCPVVTKRLADSRNHVLKSALYYETAQDLRNIILDHVGNEERWMKVMLAQYQEVYDEHSLEQRMKDVFAKVFAHA